MRKSTKISSVLGVVAGIGVAISPLTAFATQPKRTDTLNVEVVASCTINGSKLNDAGTDLATTDPAQTEVALTNTYEATLTPGVEGGMQKTFGLEGESTEQFFTINCNYADGYKIVATASEDAKLKGETGKDNADAFIPAAASAENASYWNATVTTTGNLIATGKDAAGAGNETVISASGTTVAANTKGSATDGDTFKVAYKVGAASELKAGKYSGNVTYTLVKGAN